MTHPPSDPEPPRAPAGRPRTARVAAGLLLGALLGSGGAVRSTPAVPGPEAWQRPEAAPSDAAEDSLRAAHQRLKRALARLAPRGPYLVVDTAQNVVTLKSGDRVIHRAVASTGSGRALVDPTGNRRWVFETPRGVFSVQSRLVNPVWRKPDWAFLEEGQPIPRDQSARAEAGVLGDYALGFGNGYFIHGTLYTRLIGQNVTHGCVRLGDEDLRQIYHAVSLGTPVYIY